ncbi:creatininase family protein [Peribacillus deserti]|uniref:Creatininase n=1 Tax=Peribacillus deserti TaxID=673318 RepID=A0A2N5M646_9BACI|nr:creatininase family protein [Peribacillus deserti]PLT29838.1 hypothetical protein CUU66_11080 [Peribacillus deserti]
MSFVELKYLTSYEAAVAARQKGAIGLIPVGALEQHGPHLPLVTDSAMVEVLAAAAAERFREPVIVTPTLMAGLSDHHVEFPGTVSLDRKTLKGEIGAYITSLNRMGLTRICLLSFHGGNFSFLGDCADDNLLALQGVQIEAYTDFRQFLNVMHTAGQKAGLQLASTDSHAGALETSLVLHVLGEERVREFETVQGYTRNEHGWMETMQAKGVKAVSATGVFGTPCGASASAGKMILDALVDEVALWLGETFLLEEIR